MLPLVITAGVKPALRRLWDTERASLEAKLYAHGALLFRGFRIDDEAAFADALESVAGPLLDYVDGIAPRTKLKGRVYTSTEYPPNEVVPLHNELSYAKRWPSRLYFCCTLPAQSGGETPLGDSRALLEALNSDTVSLLKERGVRYVRNLHAGKGVGLTWMQVFETQDRAAVERYCEAAGMELTWKSDGGAKVTHRGHVTVRHPVTGDEVFFNHVEQYHLSHMGSAAHKALLKVLKGEENLPFHVTFGDGSAIPMSVFEDIRACSARVLVKFPWEKGDLLVVDNLLASHGRMPFKGPRRVLVAMS